MSPLRNCRRRSTRRSRTGKPMSSARSNQRRDSSFSALTLSDLAPPFHRRAVNSSRALLRTLRRRLRAPTRPLSSRKSPARPPSRSLPRVPPATMT